MFIRIVISEFHLQNILCTKTCWMSIWHDFLCLTAVLFPFYSASALFAVQTAVIARPFLSIHLPVCPSHSGVLSRSNEDTIVRFSASGRTILVSGEVKLIRIFAGDQWGTPMSLAKSWSIIGHSLETVQIGGKLVHT